MQEKQRVHNLNCTSH